MMFRGNGLRTWLAWAVFAAGSTPAADWPAWRGPNQDGTSAETSAPTRWSRTENVHWRAPLTPGNSTPIVSGDTVFVTTSLPGRRALLALDRRLGKVRWTRGIVMKSTERTHGSNPACSPSPVTDGERVIAWFGSGGLIAFDREGKTLWAVDLGPQQHRFGYGSSPVLHGDRVFLNFGPGVSEFIVALDKRTGRELWRATSPTPGDDDTYGTWSTPFVTAVDGQVQLLVALRDYFAALDPANGREIWRCDGLGLQAKSSPIAGEGIAVVSGDLRGAEVAVKLGGKGDVTDTHRIWREIPPRQRVATGVIHRGHIYSARANGILDCVALDTGNVVWAERQSGAGANSAIWSSPILVGDKLYVNNQGGDTIIFRASPTFTQIAVNSLSETCNASPVVADGELLIRTHVALWCIRDSLAVRPPASEPSAKR